MNKYDRFLPVGSVVGVEKYAKPYMIVKNGLDKEYYLGVKHPLGYDSEESVIKFKVENITNIYFIGYLNKELESQRQKLNFERLLGGKKNG